MSMQNVTIPFIHSQDVTLDEKGIRLVNYYDFKKENSDDECTELIFPYPVLKVSLLESYVLSDGINGFAGSIEKNTFKMDKSDVSMEVLNEAKKLQAFANDLVKSIEDAQQRLEDETK